MDEKERMELLQKRVDDGDETLTHDDIEFMNNHGYRDYNPQIQLVLQREDTACGYACSAMLLNKSYTDVVEEMQKAGIVTKKVPGAKMKGLMFIDICAYLNAKNINTKTKKLTEKTKIRDYLPLLTERTLLVVGNKQNKHFVIWDNGLIFCPLDGIFTAQEYINHQAREVTEEDDTAFIFEHVFYSITITT